jgi:tetratricopeptide (TPR) repeat protein
MRSIAFLLVLAAVCVAKPAPADADALSRGRQEQQYGNYAAAADLYDQALRTDSLNADTWYRRGVCLVKLLEAPTAKTVSAAPIDTLPVYAVRAQANFTRALMLDTALVGAWHMRGVVRCRWTDPNGTSGLADLSRAIQLNPRFAEAFRSRGEYYATHADLAPAVADFGQLIVLAPSDAKALEMRAQLFFRDKQYQKSIDDLTKVLAIVAGPYSAEAERLRAEALRLRGEAYLNLSDYDKAMLDHRQAVGGLGPDGGLTLAYLWADRAFLAAQKRDFVLAIDLYTRALELSPGAERAYYGRARANFDRGRCELAIADCDTLLSHNPESYLDYVLRAQAQARIGLDARARADATRALDIARKNGVALPDSVMVFLRQVTAKGAGKAKR